MNFYEIDGVIIVDTFEYSFIIKQEYKATKQFDIYILIFTKTYIQFIFVVSLLATLLLFTDWLLLLSDVYIWIIISETYKIVIKQEF